MFQDRDPSNGWGCFLAITYPSLCLISLILVKFSVILNDYRSYALLAVFLGCPFLVDPFLAFL